MPSKAQISEYLQQTIETALNNTGTCCVCGNRQKLKDGNLVDHGFTIRWHERQGSCKGVGFPPWEVSPKGAIAYLETLLAVRSQFKGRLEEQSINQEINWVTSKLRGWKPQPLP